LRFNYDDNYFSHQFQGIPRHGYTEVVEGMLEGVPVRLNERLTLRDGDRFDHVFYTGPLDAWFGYCHGRLAYRTLDFKSQVVYGDGLGTSVLNYCDQDVPYTRRTEHKHFTPWESHDTSLIFTEYSRECGPSDEPYYPIRLTRDKEQLALYSALARASDRVTFVGRLGTYRYLDMDVTVAEALAVADNFLGRKHE
jgi:UDP-galactopyranose mutase